MKFKCPNCHSVLTSEELSPFAYLNCPDCGIKFRVAEARHIRSVFEKAWLAIRTAPIGACTYCVYCDSPIPADFLSDGTIAVPEVCCRCGRNLPPPVPAVPVPAVPVPAVPVPAAPVPAVPVPAAPVPAAPVPVPVPAAPVPVPPPVPEPPKPVSVPEPPKPVSVPEPPKPVPVPEPPPKLTGHYKDIYRKAVEENGGKDLTDVQFRELLKRL